MFDVQVFEDIHSIVQALQIQLRVTQASTSDTLQTKHFGAVAFKRVKYIVEPDSHEEFIIFHPGILVLALGELDAGGMGAPGRSTSCL